MTERKGYYRIIKATPTWKQIETLIGHPNSKSVQELTECECCLAPGKVSARSFQGWRKDTMDSCFCWVAKHKDGICVVPSLRTVECDNWWADEVAKKIESIGKKPLYALGFNTGDDESP